MKTRDQINADRRAKYAITKEQHSKLAREYYNSNKESIKSNAKNYYYKNIDRIQNYRLINRDEILVKKILYKINNKDKVSLYNKEYQKQHRVEINNRKTNYRKNNPNYKILENLRSRFRELLKSKSINKATSVKSLIGCSIEELKIHLESKFYPNKETNEMMTWENYGFYGWHVDHIRPCASFALEDPEQQKQCFHYTNLQPLWWKENLIKQDKF